jgi:hypothetical protein
MPIPLQITFDCADPPTLSEFWAAALGYRQDWQWDDATTAWMREGGLDAAAVGGRCAISDPEGVRPRLFFQRVTERKLAKNRLHLDLHVGNDNLDAEAQRLVQLGATVAHVAQHKFGPLPEERWIVMRDPEGNEFCLD